MKFTTQHEINDQGSHRVAIVVGGQVVRRGEWVSYQNIASVQFEGRSFCAVTQYFAGNPGVKPETVFEVIDAP